MLEHAYQVKALPYPLPYLMWNGDNVHELYRRDKEFDDIEITLHETYARYFKSNADLRTLVGEYVALCRDRNAAFSSIKKVHDEIIKFSDRLMTAEQ